MKTLIGLSFITLWCASIWGWLWNIVKFVGLLDGGVTAMFVARIVGIFFAPLGCVLGYF